MGEEMFVIPLAASLLGFCVAQLVLHAVLLVLFGGPKWQTSAAHQMFAGLFGLAFGVVCCILKVVVRACVSILRWWLLLFLVFLGFSCLYVTYHEYPGVWVGFTHSYNVWVGPYVHQTVIIPLKIADVLLRGLLPLWNSVFWFLKALAVQGVVPILLNEAQILLKLATALVHFSEHLVVALAEYLDTFLCTGSACLVPETRVLDLVTCLGDVREMAALGVQLVRALCGSIAAPVDIVTFPLLDLNFAEGVHSLINSLLELLAVLPQATVERCKLRNGDAFDVMMCTPDLVPFFSSLTSSMSSLGALLDNWLNIVLVIVQEALTGSSPTCDPVMSGQIPDLVANSSVFGGRPTVLVGLTSWLYAVTDGSLAVYMGATAGDIRAQMWPYPMDVGMGVAAVTYGGAHSMDVSAVSGGPTPGSMQTTSLLGCNCSDTAQGVEILCAILPMAGIPTSSMHSEYLLQALFPDEATPGLLACGGLDIYVKSSRWSFKRYESGTASLGSGGTTRSALPSNDCIARGTCRDVDATVWVVPRCGGDTLLNNERACLPTSSCIPFCMAARPAGSGNNNLMLVGASRWRNGYALLQRDCALSGATPGSTQTRSGTSGTVSSVQGPSSGILQGSMSAGVYAFSPTPVECQRAQRVMSLVDKPPTPRGNIVMSGQPFVIAGDTIFTEKELGGGASSVVVERLVGDESNLFSLGAINQDLPAEPRALTPAEEGHYTGDRRVLIPYSYQATRVVATTSRNYVFYASNPEMDVFSAYFAYCSRPKGADALPQFGLLMTSSYAPIRVYRVSAYRRCQAYSCGANLVEFTTIPGFVQNFSRSCDQTFNVLVWAMEYLNEDNIAVTLLVSRVDNYRKADGAWAGDGTYYRTVWLNPPTMQVQDTIWQTAVPSSSLATLCPAQQRLPKVGTFLAETINSGVFLVRFVVFSVVYTPGMVNVWRAGGGCPVVPGGTYGHSMLQNCGGDLYSLEDLFDSLEDATAVFWNGLVVIGRLVAPSSIASPVSEVLEGMSKYGEGTIDIWTARLSVMTLTKLPIRDDMQGLWGYVQSGGTMFQGVAHVSGSVTSWARYNYRVLMGITLSIAMRVLRSQTLSAKDVWASVWAEVYDSQDYFRHTVRNKEALACAGLRLLFGVGSPWSDVVYYQCSSGVALSEGLSSLVLGLFVDVPMAKCVCKDSAGLDPGKYVMEVCAPQLPLSLLPTIYMIANQIQGRVTSTPALGCASVLEFVKKQVNGSMEEWFLHQYASLDALGSSIDYLTGTFDSQAGQCQDFQHDPHVVVIVPWPAEYFMQCGKTTLCKSMCRPEWEQFQAVLTTPVPLEDVTVTAESMFFPGQLDRSLMLSNVTAATQVPATGVCTDRPEGVPADYALALAEFGDNQISVQFWCAPRMASASVYRNTNLGYSSGALPGSLMSISFGGSNGAWLVLLLRGGDMAGVYWVDAYGLHSTPSVEPHVPYGLYPVRIAAAWAIMDVIVVDVVTRHFEGTTNPSSVGGLIHLFMPPGNSTWFGTDVDLTQFLGHYMFTRVASGDHYFFPRIAGLPMYRSRFIQSDTLLVRTEHTMMGPADMSAIYGDVLAGASLGEDYMFAVSSEGWDWLHHVRFSMDGVDGVFNSAPVTYTVRIQGNCNEQSCEGCPDVTSQRLCLAYNKCALVNCVGTAVNQYRPLCGVGQLLRHYGTMSLQGMHGSWTIFTEMLALSLDLSLTSVDELRLQWPEDAFLCHVCKAKDASAQFFSILTSTLNAALQMGHANLGYMYGGASNVDTNADAALTITSTALNAFMHQLALAPLFAMVTSKQIMMCQLNGVIALMDVTGFKLSLQPSDKSMPGDAIAGQCLTIGMQSMAQYPQSNQQSLGHALSSTVTNALELLVLKQIEPLLHTLDMVFAYFMGVVHTLGVLVMSQFAAKCNPPDFYLKDVVKCACGDQELSIPAASRAQGIAEMALWCSGVLTMVDSNSRQYLVYNPYTYSELQALSAGMEEYVQCVSGGANGYDCPPPADHLFTDQGVSVLNVLVKCRENYMRRRWDPNAYVLFDRKQHHLLRYKTLIPVPDMDPWGVWSCMLGDPSSGSLVATCLEEFQAMYGVTDEQYWAYERATLHSPEYTDACLVFSGPAQAGGTKFEQCVDGPGMGNCTLPAHCWSPLSDNNVPVCEQHRLLSHGINPDGLVQRLYKEAQTLVWQATLDSIGSTQRPNAPIQTQIFSVEGDVLHQTMDCIFMGPYSRVDYWPIPVCVSGEECLNGPFWARDDWDGLSRSVDSDTCMSDSSLPYTCGSPARRALMRYFVNKLLPSKTGGAKGDSSLIQEILNRTLHRILEDWSDTGLYGCTCADGATVAPSCCTLTSPLLPAVLNRPFEYISSHTVLDALEDDFGQMYDQAIQSYNVWREYLDDTAPGESSTYDWSGSHRATDEARFKPTAPVYEYSADETMTPLLDKSSTLWDICHASLKQVFFTLPVNPSSQVVFEMGEFDGDPSRLEEYVRAFTAQAFLSSPLYRHYSPRHTPSPSQMCKQQPPSNTSTDGTVEYQDFLQAGHTLLDGRSLPPMPAYDYRRFGIGHDACLCGWRLVGARCAVPSGLTCNDCIGKKVCASDCTYARADEPLLVTGFSVEWTCPEVELSPHWGLTDAQAAESWMRNLTALSTSSRDLLQYGRAGLRIGNLGVLKQISKTYISPVTREVPLSHGALTTCGASAAWSEDLTKAFVDELFPAAQGVEEAGAVAYCLRYVIEVARLEVLNMTMPWTREFVVQRELVSTWRRRCGAQLQVVHLCVNLDVFHARPVSDGAARKCQHFKAFVSGGAYSTPECLVNIGGVFYDPCRCVACQGDASWVLPLAQIQRDSCRLRFDPRRMLNQGPIGRWEEGSALNEFMLDPANLLGDWFLQDVLSDRDATGNVEDGEEWWDAEGPMNQTSEFCDMVLDWWPDDWDYPVGYHVTVPCAANDTAYRSFVQAFSLEYDSAGGPVLTYQHDLLRDASMVDTNFGVGGLCRTTNFGMPMHETNTMRYCTSIPSQGTEDFTLPVRGGVDGTSYGWTDPQCTTSSRDLPWPDFDTANAPYASALFSIGTVPNMPRADATTYPHTQDDMWNIGPWQEVRVSDTWGQGSHRCSDFDLYMCVDATTCPSGFTCRGRVCKYNSTKSCTAHYDCETMGPCEGVCVDTSMVDCIMHADCPGDKACTGLGKCVTPTIVVQNRLDNNISFQLAVQGTCNATAGAAGFSMLGASYWGYMSQDLLRGHGMCSFEDWFKYTQYTSKPPCSTPYPGYLDVDPTRCSIVNLQSTTNQTVWWGPGQPRPDMMYLRPTNCDRDYERLDGFEQCVPTGTSVLLLQNGQRSAQASKDQFTRLHRSGTSILMARMPDDTDLSFGFLGLGSTISSIDQLLSTGDHPFVSCATLGQCYASPFTVLGKQATRTIAASGGTRLAYPENTVFKCGSFGVDTGMKCILDEDVLPLYRFLCNPNYQLSACTNIIPSVTSACTNIQYSYYATNSDRSANLKALQQLFYLFPGFTDMAGYLKVTTCMDALYNAMKGLALKYPGKVSNGFYFPFMFVLYEFPFAWFYQCMVMGGWVVNTASRGQQDCVAFQHRGEHTIDAYTSVSSSGSDDPMTYLRFVQGVYLQSNITVYDAINRKNTDAAVMAARTVVQRRMFPKDPTADKSYPQCSTNLLWQIREAGKAYDNTHPYNPRLRALIANWYNTETCESSWQIDMIQDLPPGWGILPTNWIQELTIADPDPGNLVPQSMGVTTMLDTITHYIQQSMGVKMLDRTQTPNNGILWYSQTPPDTYDLVSYPLEPGLNPMSQGNIGRQVTLSDRDLQLTCAFLQPDDPLQTNLQAESCSLTDGGWTRTCDKTLCTVVPRAWRKDGMFGCRYVAEGRVIPSDCTETSPGCAQSVMTSMYAAVLNEYTPPTSNAQGFLKPILAEWFQPDKLWSGAFTGFDLTAALNYQNNIQPNPDKAVMCEINTDASSAIKFMACQNPHYQALKAHAQKHYKHDGSTVIPAGGQMVWSVGRSMFTQGAIYAYANQNRSKRQTYMDALFDDDTVCSGSVTANQRVCWKQDSGAFTPINPWMLGYFNPYSMCDVDFMSQSQGGNEYIYSFCAQGNTACPNFNSMPVPNQCNNHFRERVSMPGVPRVNEGDYLDYNLCQHTLDEGSDTCLHDQGLLGGFDGMPVGAPADSTTMLYDTKYDGHMYTVAKNMYEPSKWAIPADFQGGLFAGTNPLWAGQTAPYGYLQMGSTDIGGHSIGLSVSRQNKTDTISLMLLEYVALNHDDPSVLLDTAAIQARNVSKWIPSLKAQMAADAQANARLYEVQFDASAMSASCPLQRWMFYSGAYQPFSPTIPSPRRARHLFWRINGFSMAHPTMTQVTDGRYLGEYKTSNGFCACPVLQDIPQSQCLAPVAAGACSLLETIQSLQAVSSRWYQSMVYAPLDDQKRARTCDMQLDWPGVDNPLRDGSPVDGSWQKASNPSHKKCHVLDRLRPFRYQYRSASTLAPASANTIQAGVCQTRRVVALDVSTLPSTGRCVRDTLLSGQATFACEGTTSVPSMPRPVPLTAQETVTRARTVRRQACGSCAPPPHFQTGQGGPIPPESSFGQLFSMSAERLLAKDLRDALCNATGGCPRFNTSAWLRGQFMRNYLLSPQRLFLPALEEPKPVPNPPLDDSARWEEGGWVYCPTGTSLRTGEGCKGTIPRRQWVLGKTSICPRMVKSLSLNGSTGEDPMSRTLFCNLDASTSAVCSAIVRARGLVEQANCIASRDPACMPSPFVYHPATYDRSNNAWVHDTVTAFYRQISSQACPASSNSQGLAEYNRKYAQSCPANSIRLFESLLNIMRVIVTDIAMLFSTLVSMALKLFALLFNGQRETMKQYLLSDWSYVKKQGKQMMLQLSDLFIDLLLNSGKLGAQLMYFLAELCSKINEAINWFLNIWCNYIQEYMVQFLSAMRQGMGMIASGFEILNDFMDEVFMGVLPASFIQKYGNTMFQSLMTEKYSEPTAHEDKVKAKAHVSNQINVKPSSKVSRARNAANSLFNTLLSSSSIRMAARFGAGLAVVGAAYEVYSGLSGLFKSKGFYPDNFTLFDFSDVVNTMDDMEAFMESDGSCFTYQAFQEVNLTYQRFPCLALNIDKYKNTSAGTTSLDATLCWADSSPSLGQNSLFSCTASSTCCETTACFKFVMCDTCPVPTLQGVNRFGCDAIRQKCVCGQVQTSFDLCSANRQCDIQAQCVLVSSLDGVSYGTIPCGKCPSSGVVMCMLPRSGLPGQCSCLMDHSMRYDLCSGAPGTETIVDATRLCGYLPGYSARSTQWMFDMEDLMIAPCLQVSRGVCSTVHLTDNANIYMVVALTVRTASGRRRLLSDDPLPPETHTYETEYDLLDPDDLHALLTAPGWNTTAPPCAQLAQAYQQERPLGVLEITELNRCGYWRYVGRWLVARHNLSALEGHDTFLLSWDDLSHALMAPGVVQELALHPLAVLHAVLYHPWVKPLRALGAIVANLFEQLVWLGEVHSTLLSARLKDMEEEAEPWLNASSWSGRRLLVRRTPRPPSPPVAHVLRGPARGAFFPVRPTGPPRRSLQLVQQDAAAIQPSDAQDLELSVVSGEGAGGWTTSDFVWPPVYSFSLSTCPVALSVLHLGHEVLLVNRMYFQTFRSPRPAIDRSLRATLPDINWTSMARLEPTVTSTRSWASTMFHWLLALLQIRPSDLVTFFTGTQKWTLQWVLNSAIKCDLAAVNTCSGHTKDVVMSTVLFAFLYVLLNMVGAAVGFPMLSTLLLLSYPGFILWYSFGVSPQCAPLVPTCLLADLIVAVEWLLPTSILFPSQLLCYSTQSTQQFNQTCLRSCTDLNYTAWLDPLGFMVCDVDAAACASWANQTVGWAPADELVQPLRDSMWKFTQALARGGDPVAYRVCAWVSFISVLPVVALAVGFFVVLASLLLAVLDLIPQLMLSVAQLYVFHKAG